MSRPFSQLRSALSKALPKQVVDEYYRWRFQFLSEAKLITQYADPRRSAIDVGANRGAVTRLLARRCPHVYSYEPNPRARASLERSRAKNVTVYPYACSDQRATLELVEPIWHGAASHAHSSLDRKYDGFDVHRTAVEAVRLDDMGHEAHDIGFIKIDVEGHELSTIRGARELIRAARPTLWIEMDGYGYPGGIQTGIAEIVALGYQAFFHYCDQIHPASSFNEAIFQPRNPETGGHLAGYLSEFMFIPN